eukprot:Gregarina_sp_Poly_1__5695@NODE_2_length_28028_cov_167_134223_g1_i0_p5_GENE_NODE_2_length_28028_cov_167_134223_g1_i0NODE_2_length_28028_cov_167_134223_g1_i0_p5_ORF_typecomplete_len573_score43_33_NODE_2_length_28028_cov_167_134223_g1_i080239741
MVCVMRGLGFQPQVPWTFSRPTWSPPVELNPYLRATAVFNQPVSTPDTILRSTPPCIPTHTPHEIINLPRGRPRVRRLKSKRSYSASSSTSGDLSASWYHLVADTPDDSEYSRSRSSSSSQGCVSIRNRRPRVSLMQLVVARMMKGMLRPVERWTGVHMKPVIMDRSTGHPIGGHRLSPKATSRGVLAQPSQDTKRCLASNNCESPPLQLGTNTTGWRPPQPLASAQGLTPVSVQIPSSCPIQRENPRPHIQRRSTMNGSFKQPDLSRKQHILPLKQSPANLSQKQSLLPLKPCPGDVSVRHLGTRVPETVVAQSSIPIRLAPSSQKLPPKRIRMPTAPASLKAFDLLPRTVPTTSTSPPNPRMNLEKMEVNVEKADCQSVNGQFASVYVRARWVIPDFEFMRRLAKDDALPGGLSSTLRSPVFGSEFTLCRRNGTRVIFRFAFKMRCLPYGDPNRRAFRRGHVGVYIDCHGISVLDAGEASGTRAGVQREKNGGYIGRSLVFINLVNQKGEDMPNTSVEHIFARAEEGITFAFPKYLTVRNESDVAGFLKAAQTGKTLVLRFHYKTLIAPR